MADTTVHGPMWQFECEHCDYMGDTWDTEAEAVSEMERHDCLDALPSWARYEFERMCNAGDDLVAAIRNHDLTEAHLKAWEARRDR